MGTSGKLCQTIFHKKRDATRRAGRSVSGGGIERSCNFPTGQGLETEVRGREGGLCRERAGSVQRLGNPVSLGAPVRIKQPA